MPGIILHTLFANKIYTNLKRDNYEINLFELLSGSIIPDLAKDK